MGTPEDIRRLIEEGKLASETGRGLLEAFETAEARDRVILRELRRAKEKNHKSHPSAMVVAALAFLLGACLTGLLFMVPSPAEAPSATGQSSELIPDQDVDGLITELEQKLRRPGSASDYRTLAMAYQRRYEQTQEEVDRQRAAQASARAERLERTSAMSGKASVFGLLFALVIVTAVGLWIMFLYNGVARSDERVNNRWAQIEAVLQRRLDLIPQLLEAVSGYAEHERETLLAVTEARARALGILQGVEGQPESRQTLEELGQADESLNVALRQLLALGERYPDLKASSSFVTLQDQLEATENRIATERQRYNDEVNGYNARLRVFPSNVVARWFGFEPRDYFESKIGAEDPVPFSLTN